MGPHAITSTCKKREIGRREESQRAGRRVKMEAERELSSYKPRMPRCARGHQKLGGGKEGSFPGAFRGEHGPTITLIQNSSLQNSERITFCCLKPLSVETLLRPP